jgi:hypothetical protein
VFIHHETDLLSALDILAHGFTISYQRDYPHHAFFYANRFENTTSVRKGAVVTLDFPEDLSPFAIEGADAYTEHTPLAIPFQIVNQYIKSFTID